MTQARRPRQPGDPAPGDRNFGPLGGLFDDIHHSVRAGDRAREIAALQAARRPEGTRSVLGRLVQAVRRLFRRPS